MTEIDMMVKTVIGRYKLDGIIRQDEGVIDGIEYICRLVHDGIIRYSLRELFRDSARSTSRLRLHQLVLITRTFPKV